MLGLIAALLIIAVVAWVVLPAPVDWIVALICIGAAIVIALNDRRGRARL